MYIYIYICYMCIYIYIHKFGWCREIALACVCRCLSLLSSSSSFCFSWLWTCEKKERYVKDSPNGPWIDLCQFDRNTGSHLSTALSKKNNWQTGERMKTCFSNKTHEGCNYLSIALQRLLRNWKCLDLSICKHCFAHSCLFDHATFLDYSFPGTSYF